MGTLDPDMGALVSQSLMDTGVRLYRNEALQSFDLKENRVQAIVTNNRIIPADLVVLGLDVKPNVHLAQSAGIELGPSGAVQVDETMRTTTENVWAGGDCAESFHLVSRRSVNIALRTAANKHGRVAGSNIISAEKKRQAPKRTDRGTNRGRQTHRPSGRSASYRADAGGNHRSGPFTIVPYAEN